MNLRPFGQLFLVIGCLFILFGILFLLFGRMPLLPGDLVIKKKNLVLVFPIVTGLVLSLILTVVLNGFFRR